MRASTRRIDKTLFEAGNQCAKRLHLEVHGRAVPAVADANRSALAATGQRVAELARQAFPHGTLVEGDDLETRAARTAAALDEPGAKVLFGACFCTDQTEVETDILIRDRDGMLDLLEVKAGTTIKPRHLMDVALQVHTIEAARGPVRTVTILHLDPRYRHDGSSRYPVQKLFRSVDVTRRVRRLVPKVAAHVEKQLALIDNPEVLDLPTGTWCHHPLPCRFFESCLAEGPPQPLVFLPQLTHAQEVKLHEEAIEDLSQLSKDRSGLSLVQRRALRALERGARAVEPFVVEELRDLDQPVCFLHVQWHMEVLPAFERQRPWQKIPSMWSAQVLHPNDEVESLHFVSTEAVDPRGPCIESLAEVVDRCGTVVVYQPDFDRFVRALLEDAPALKPQLRLLLNAPLLDLDAIVVNGVYDPGFRGSFALDAVYRALVGSELFDGLEIADDGAASEAFRRLLNSRTRAATRQKLGAALAAYGERISSGIAAVQASLANG